LFEARQTLNMSIVHGQCLNNELEG